jgi:predicted nucleic acid-binding protein
LKKFVVDASVAVKWMVPSLREALREDAMRLAELRSSG